MTPASTILNRLARGGVNVRLDGDDLVPRGPRSVLTAEVLAQLRQLKPSIVTELRRRTGQVPPSPAAVAERAAIIADGDHCDRATADARAFAEYGIPSWCALAGAHRENILEELARLPPASSEHVRGLVAFTRAFLDSKHWRATVALGWELIEIFGVNPHAPLIRIDGQGLLTGLALSKLSGGRLESITASLTTIRYRSGAVLTWRRGAAGLDGAAPWWKCAALVERDGRHGGTS